MVDPAGYTCSSSTQTVTSRNTQTSRPAAGRSRRVMSFRFPRRASGESKRSGIRTTSPNPQPGATKLAGRSAAALRPSMQRV
jgi:hypothetical protein